MGRKKEDEEKVGRARITEGEEIHEQEKGEGKRRVEEFSVSLKSVLVSLIKANAEIPSSPPPFLSQNNSHHKLFDTSLLRRIIF